MDAESKKLLEDTFALAQENNKILHSMKRAMWLGRVMSIVYWALIIGSTIGAYYLIQPYVDAVSNAYDGASEKVDSLNTVINLFTNSGQ